MPNFRDLKKRDQRQNLDLRGSENRKGDRAEDLKKDRNMLYKKDTPIKEVRDLDGGDRPKFLYIRGHKFEPPKHLGNILKLAGIGFLIILIVNSIGVYFHARQLQGDIETQAYEGFNFLVAGGKDATKVQFSNALDSFNQALSNFSQAENSLWFINTDNSLYAEDKTTAQAVNAMLEGGKHFAIAGTHFLDALEFFNRIPLYFIAKNQPENLDSPSLTDALKEGLDHTELAITEISQAQQNLDSINEEVLPSEIALRAKLAKQQVNTVSDTLNKTAAHFPAILKLLGDKHPHRYLILLQNNNEIRPTGGFIGSYAIVDINDGLIEKLEVHDSYDIDGSYTGVIEPPDELKAFTSNWRFRDSNYSPDYPTSAKKARWFLEKQGGPTADTVIAINQGLLRDLLQITGPVQVGDFGALTADNYNLLLSYIIEGKVWGAEDPKHILKVFIPAFKESILKEENLGKVASKLYRAVQQKHIMAYSSDTEIQDFFAQVGLTGAAYPPQDNEDYLSVVNISIGGTKSEQFIKEEINHDTEISELGKLTDTVTIKRTHEWTDDVYNQWRRTLQSYGFNEMPDYLIDILGRGENRVLTRVYVPDGSILLEGDVETKYDADLKRTYFLAKMNTKAGETSEITIKYQLPFTLRFNPADTYRLTLEKQPGTRGSLLNKTISAPTDIKNIDSYPSEVRLGTENNLTYSTNLVYDRYFSSLWER